MSQLLDTQVLYDGRWVSREHFRAFVYNSTGEKLAKTYQEFSDLISSGSWFADKKDIKSNNVVDIKPKRGRKCQNLNKV
jgi:hypothetical protein